MAIVEILFIGAVGASIGLFLGVVLTLVAFRNQKEGKSNGRIRLPGTKRL